MITGLLWRGCIRESLRYPAMENAPGRDYQYNPDDLAAEPAVRCSLTAAAQLEGAAPLLPAWLGKRFRHSQRAVDFTMIQETSTRRSRPALTSDRWHVVHARWLGEKQGRPSYVRTIVGEYEDRASAARGARELVSSLAPQMSARPLAQRDQLFVRKPGFRSLKAAGRVDRRRK